MRSRAEKMFEVFRSHWPFAMAALLLSVGLLFLSPGRSLRIHLLGSSLLHPFVTFSEAFVRGSRAVFCRTTVPEIDNVRTLELLRENIDARGALGMAAREKEGRERLQVLLRVEKGSKLKLRCTQIVRTHGKQAHYEDFVQLSCGAEDTVEPNQLVINDRKMVVGVIEVVGKDWCFMRPTTSHEFSMSVKIPKRAIKGTLTGGGGTTSDDTVSGGVVLRRAPPELRHIQIGDKAYPGDQLGLTSAHLQPGDIIRTDSAGDPDVICDGLFVGQVQQITTDRSGFPVKAEVVMARITGDEFLFVVFPSSSDPSRFVSKQEIQEALR